MDTTVSDHGVTFSSNFTGKNRNTLRNFVRYSEDLKRDILDHNVISDMTLQLYKCNAADVGITIFIHSSCHQEVVTMIDEICRDINIFFYS